jgi:hypothetical protein
MKILENKLISSFINYNTSHFIFSTVRLVNFALWLVMPIFSSLTKFGLRESRWKFSFFLFLGW